MSNNSNYSQHFKGYEELLSRVDDLVDQSERYQKARVTPFLRYNEAEAIKRYLGKRVPVRFDGGYPDAEYQRAVIGKEEGDSEIVCLTADVSNKMVKIEHRDLYGALMSLSLKREQFGDVFLKEGKAVIYCTKEASRIIMSQLTQIAHLHVSFEVSDKAIANEVKYTEFEKSVANYRLDAIVSAMANISRSKATDMIRAKLVSVNHEVNESVSTVCKDKDIISIRGYGRYVIFETISMTRKNRYLIRFGKYS